MTHAGTITNSGTVASLIKTNNTFVSDPQIMWDPTTGRFYYSIFENLGSTTPDEGIAWGFSKTPTPSGPASFCSYFNGFNFGSTSFPDRESLGESSSFLLIGSNRWGTSPEDLLGSDLAWISKPAAGSTCPAASSFSTGIQNLSNPDGTPAYTPTPAKQVGGNATGWVVATPSYVSASTLTTYSVTKSTTGDSAVISPPKSVNVPAYSSPPDAPQKGNTLAGAKAPPLQTRIYLTQAIMAYDPRVGHYAIWTANTIAGGAGAEVQWYEIDPWNSTLDQSGIIGSPSLDVFDASISPDRVVTTTGSGFGQSAVIDVNTSSTTSYPAIEVTSTIDGKPTTPLVVVKRSTGTDVDFTCFEPDANECRWGDESGAAPDPSSSLSGSYGNVWISSEWNTPDINDSTPVWKTEVSNVTP